MIENCFQYSGGDDDSASDGGVSVERQVALFGRRRSDRASVNGTVRYVLLGLLSLIGTSILATVVF